MLKKTEEDNQAELAVAVAVSSPDILQSCFADPESVLERISERLVCMKAGATYKRGRMSFVSSYVEDSFMRKFEASNDASVKAFLANSDRCPAIQAYRGKLLEAM